MPFPRKSRLLSIALGAVMLPASAGSLRAEPIEAAKAAERPCPARSEGGGREQSTIYAVCSEVEPSERCCSEEDIEQGLCCEAVIAR